MAFKDFFKKFKKEEGPIASTGPLPTKSRAQRAITTLRKSVPKNLPRNLKNIRVKNIKPETIVEHSHLLNWGLIILTVLLASAASSRIIALFIRPVYTPLPTKRAVVQSHSVTPPEDFTVIEKRNIFDVENRIPDPLDQGLLDCFAQAKASTSGMQLLATIVMGNESLSVALLQDSGSNKFAVRKDETFLDRYQALKVERKKFCYMVKATQEMEYVEIPDEGGEIGGNLTNSSGGGIMPKSETTFEIKQTYLDNQLKDLNTVLQTAKAVPFTDSSGHMKGFLMQSIDPESPFSQLGLRQGDVLAGVNDIVLDNAGKGLEAFQRLRSSNKIELKIMRGGQEMTLSYDVKM